MSINNNPNIFNNNNINNNTNNINNNETFVPFHNVTHENLFIETANSDIKSLHFFPNSNLDYQTYPQQNYFSTKPNKFTEIQDYNKIHKEEKYKQIINDQKKNRFMHNFGNKIKEAENYKEKYSNNNKELFIDDYIDKVKEVYQDKDSYYDFIERNGSYNFSNCPFCGNPVVFFLEKVFCINKCFMTAVGEGVFDNEYTLSNFMEQYKNYYSNHLDCKSDLVTLYVDNESKCAEFLCLKCQKDYLNL